MKARSLIEMFESCDENTQLLVSCNGVETRTHSVNYHVKENKIVIIPISLADGEPCTHIGCLNHITHPCEGCGRIAGRRVINEKSNGGFLQ